MGRDLYYLTRAFGARVGTLFFAPTKAKDFTDRDTTVSAPTKTGAICLFSMPAPPIN